VPIKPGSDVGKATRWKPGQSGNPHGVPKSYLAQIGFDASGVAGEPMLPRELTLYCQRFSRPLIDALVGIALDESKQPGARCKAADVVLSKADPTQMLNLVMAKLGGLSADELTEVMDRHLGMGRPMVDVTPTSGIPRTVAKDVAELFGMAEQRLGMTGDGSDIDRAQQLLIANGGIMTPEIYEALCTAQEAGNE
jgi:hypothetical protein